VGNDPSVIATWGEDAYGNYYVIAVRRGRWEYPELMTTIHDEFALMRRRWPLLSLTIEDKASGQSALQSLRQPLALAGGGVLPALPVLPFPLPGDPYEAAMAGLSKLARAEVGTPIIAAGRVKLPQFAKWKEAFIEEHERFPVGQHDDQVDTTSTALIRLASRSWQGGAAVGGERVQMEVR
jgi:phage terminase large subunit-like protein